MLAQSYSDLQINESPGMKQLTERFGSVNQHQRHQRGATVETYLIQQRLRVFILQHQID